MEVFGWSRTGRRAVFYESPVITIVTGVNNERVGRVVEFALDNPKRINFLSFQPVSFTGRDEEATPERRRPALHALRITRCSVKFAQAGRS